MGQQSHDAMPANAGKMQVRVMNAHGHIVVDSKGCKTLP
jgi:hypothetical protein